MYTYTYTSKVCVITRNMFSALDLCPFSMERVGLAMMGSTMLSSMFLMSLYEHHHLCTVKSVKDL